MSEPRYIAVPCEPELYKAVEDACIRSGMKLGPFVAHTLRKKLKVGPFAPVVTMNDRTPTVKLEAQP